MEFTWSALCIGFLFITPALPFFFWFRVMLPRSVPTALNEGRLWIGLAITGALINLNLLGYVAKAMCEQIIRTTQVSALHQELIKLLLAQEFHPWRPIIRLTEFCHFGSVSRTSIWALLIDLHLRTFLLGMFLAVLFKSISYFSDWKEARKWESLLKESGRSSKQVAEFTCKRGALSSILNWIRAGYLSPWALLTLYNPQRELLMLDVLTKKDGMYSGFFTGYIAEGAEMRAVSLQYVVQYAPERTVPSGATSTEARREKTLVKNNGELIIPMDDVANLHFWEIRKRFRLNLGVANGTWLAVLKQYALLSRIFPGFINEINVYLRFSDQEERKEFLRDYLHFAKLHGIAIDENSLVKFVVPKPASPKQEDRTEELATT